MFRPTQASLNLVRQIAEQVPTFHHHYHLIYDIAKLFYKDSETINYVEIGAFKGASSSLMATRPNTIVTAIDRLDASNSHEIIENVNKFKHKESQFNFITGDSQSPTTYDLLVSTLNGKDIDILFIDGDHSYDGVIADFNKYRGLLRGGAFVVFDDYNDKKYCPEVKPAVDYIVANLIDPKRWLTMGAYENNLEAHPAEMKEGNCFILRHIF
jgi:predicted O-methyltransferase YrrM